MRKVFKLIALCTAGIFLISGIPYAEMIDVSVPIVIEATVGAVATLSVTVRDIATDAVAATISFTDPGAATWTVANEYLQVVYDSNYPLWAVRIVTNNLDPAFFPAMAARQLDDGLDGVYDTDPTDGYGDDVLSYSGLIDAATQDNPENRADLAWQVYVAPTGAGALTDASLDVDGDGVNGEWNDDWAYVVDVGNAGVNTEGVNMSFDPEVDSDGDVDTLAYPTVIQGGPAGSGLAFHPALDVDGVPGVDPRPGDEDVAVYLGARFGGLSTGSYSANLRVQLIHE